MPISPIDLEPYLNEALNHFWIHSDVPLIVPLGWYPRSFLQIASTTGGSVILGRIFPALGARDNVVTLKLSRASELSLAPGAYLLADGGMHIRACMAPSFVV